MFKHSKRIYAVMFTVIMLICIASNTIYAKDVMEMTIVSPQYVSPSDVTPLAVDQVETYEIRLSDDTLVGTGNFEYATDGVAYGSCKSKSSTYPYAYCRMTSYEFKPSVGLYESKAEDYAYTYGITYAALSANEQGTTVNSYPPYVHCLWIVYEPNANNLIPSGSPSNQRAFYK